MPPDLQSCRARLWAARRPPSSLYDSSFARALVAATPPLVRKRRSDGRFEMAAWPGKRRRVVLVGRAEAELELAEAAEVAFAAPAAGWRERFYRRVAAAALKRQLPGVGALLRERQALLWGLGDAPRPPAAAAAPPARVLGVVALGSRPFLDAPGNFEACCRGTRRAKRPAAGRAKLDRILRDQLGLRAKGPADRRDLHACLRSVSEALDRPSPSGRLSLGDAARELTRGLGAGSWAVGLARDGALLVLGDGGDCGVALRAMAGELELVEGLHATVLGPYHYPRGALGVDGLAVYLGAFRRGTVSALRVSGEAVHCRPVPTRGRLQPQ